MDIQLTPKQGIDFLTRATEVLYGGAAGGGKSYVKRASAIRWCVEVPGIQVYFFRRTLPDLRDNHLRGPTSFQVLLDPYLRSGHVKGPTVENEFRFWNGSILHLCYCDSENDVEKYRGAEIHVLIIDELTHFSEYQYRFLRSRVRIAGLSVPEKYKEVLPRIECASNPGSIGHAWVKRTFVSPKPAGEVWRTSKEDEGGMLRQYIPARLVDNPHLTKDDPNYADRLRGLGTDALVRAMLEGDWDIVAGQAFEKLRRDIHCIEPFTPPDDWLCFGSFDWGSSKPFSFGMWTVANGNPLPDGRTYRRGAIIRFNEWYGWTGKADEGLRLEASEVAKGIKARLKRKFAYIACDPALYKVDGGPSHAETFLKNGVVLRKADNNREPGYVEVRGRIAGDEEGPMLYATKNCHDGFWRTMPDLIMDENHPEDLDTDQEDHCFAAGTEVLTYKGPRPIESVGHTLVMTRDGWREAFAIPPRTALCVKLTYDDGSEVICTPEHRFLNGSMWKHAVDQLDEISYNALSNRRVAWSESLVRRAKNFLVFAIGCAASTSSAREFGSIGLYGNTTGGQFQTGCTYTTSTGTDQKTESRIWIWSRSQNTFLTMAESEIDRAGSRRCEQGLGSGTVARRDALGILSTLKATWRRFWPRVSQRIANSAVRLLWLTRLSRLALSFATLTARPRRCVSVEPVGSRAVYCLYVPSEHNFALADGSIVHNCYDEVRYACMSRPWTQIQLKKKEKPDRWMRRFEEQEDMEDSWKVI